MANPVKDRVQEEADARAATLWSVAEALHVEVAALGAAAVALNDAAALTGDLDTYRAASAANARWFEKSAEWNRASDEWMFAKKQAGLEHFPPVGDA